MATINYDYAIVFLDWDLGSNIFFFFFQGKIFIGKKAFDIAWSSQNKEQLDLYPTCNTCNISVAKDRGVR
jgi:hypothetical protein